MQGVSAWAPRAPERREPQRHGDGCREAAAREAEGGRRQRAARRAAAAHGGWCEDCARHPTPRAWRKQSGSASAECRVGVGQLLCEPARRQVGVVAVVTTSGRSAVQPPHAADRWSEQGKQDQQPMPHSTAALTEARPLLLFRSREQALQADTLSVPAREVGAPRACRCTGRCSLAELCVGTLCV
jgi:hypothetical protein